ncbi:MAG: hypothetical protein JNL57_09205 [Bacteroidetes bacterium]|nr:hypothetical protein [Bacteroidota bacterium]
MAKRDLLDFSFSDLGFTAMALHCNLPPHTLAWLIDRCCMSGFQRRVVPLEVPLRKISSAHIYFYHDVPETETSFWLLENRGTAGILSTGRPDPDFLLVAKGEQKDEMLSLWLELIKSESAVSMAYIMPADQQQRLNWLPYLTDSSE